MMRGVASTLEKHHRVQLLDEALEAAVRLSHRYIPARQLPDKAVSLLDTACARVAVSQHAVPAEVEDSRRRIEALETELEIIGREKAVGVDTAQREAQANEKLGDEARAARRARSALGRGEGARRPASSRCAPSCAAPPSRSRRQQRAREGADATRAAEPKPRRPRAHRLERERCCRSCMSAQAQLARAPGRDAADPAERRRAGGRLGRRATGPASRSAAWSRTRSRPCSSWPTRSSQRVIGQRHALEDDREAHPDLARRARQSEQADRRLHAVRARRASARPRPRWRSPRRSTAASRTSSPST